MMTFPRGIRMNNPGNVELKNDKWHGMSAIQFDQRFITFDDPKWGLRAIVRIILNYNRVNHNIDTVREIINKWAPPTENDTDAYVKHVSIIACVKPDEALNLKDKRTLIGIVKGIVMHENGKSQNEHNFWYSDALYQEAVNLALT
jgi:hypothetical protein